MTPRERSMSENGAENLKIEERTSMMMMIIIIATVGPARQGQT
jgi:hypothetical protein